MNEIVKRSTTLPADFGDQLMKGIDQTLSSMPAGVDGTKPLLRLLTNGQWVYGQSNEPVQRGSSWAVNVATMAWGWVCWDDGEMRGQNMASVLAARLPQPPPVNGAPFKEQYSLELTCIDGEDQGVLVLYKNNSMGFTKAFEDLLSSIKQRYVADKNHFWPIVTLEEESYWSKKYAKDIWNPIMSIVGWANADGEIVGSTKPIAASAKPAEPAKPAKPAKPPLTPAAAAAPPQPDPAPATPVSTQQLHAGQRRRPAARG